MPPERAKIQEELADLQLEEAREAAETRRMNRTQRIGRIAALERSLRKDRQNQLRIQSGCAHRKGGKGTSQIYQGNDANYAVVTHTLSHGPTMVVCQRCGKLWLPPEPLPKRATAEQKLKYREDMAEYRRARNLPTDNEPSGTVLFSFTPDDEEAA